MYLLVGSARNLASETPGLKDGETDRAARVLEVIMLVVVVRVRVVRMLVATKLLLVLALLSRGAL